MTEASRLVKGYEIEKYYKQLILYNYMATPLIAPVSQDFLQKTLGSSLSSGGTTATLNNTTSIQNLKGVAIIDRVDTNGVETPTKREVVTFTGTSGSNLTGVTRGLAGTSDQDHATGAVVEFGPDIVWAQSIYDGLSETIVASTGALDTTKVVDLSTAQTLAGPKTLTNPTVTTGTFAKPTINASIQGIAAASDGATVTFDLSVANIHTVTLGGNRTLALSNATTGQCFVLRLLQDGTGSRTVTWFTTIKWAGGSAPTLTTTASKADTFGFICTSSNNYDGYVIGQNI